MTQQSIQSTGKQRILIADDEPDIHTVTKLSLKGLIRRCGPIEFLSASSGKATVEALGQYPDIGVILLDVVMETDDAGLVACRSIREDLGNRLVRILLRTGQPGVAPEQQTIDTYDIDGYLAKTETSANRLYTAVRCALKSYQELLELERHRACLAAVHACAVALTATQPVERLLRSILETVIAICPAPLVALELQTFEHGFGPRQLFLHLAAEPSPTRAAVAAEEARSRVQRALGAGAGGPVMLEGGFLVPLRLHQELGHGWIYVEGAAPDDLTRKSLGLLGGHAENAVYAALALSASRERRALVFEEVAI